ncbi:hypothetical protein MCHIJ_36380 [Mycolicibacterium chitae]|nr:hypothetical protein [Mycolicibacterium chitae]BBZ04201.1 hypothetical protein MCHIJ_36380 [Mycolicibacterium chitae]
MTATSKVEARRRAREATRRANEQRAAHDKANIDDAADFLVAIGKLAEVETWKKERLAQLRAQVDAEAARRMDVHSGQAGAAVARMQGRGETLTSIAARTDVGIGIVRAMSRHAPKFEKPTAGNGSHAAVLEAVSDPTAQGSTPRPASRRRTQHRRESPGRAAGAALNDCWRIGSTATRIAGQLVVDQRVQAAEDRRSDRSPSARRARLEGNTVEHTA